MIFLNDKEIYIFTTYLDIRIIYSRIPASFKTNLLYNSVIAVIKKFEYIMSFFFIKKKRKKLNEMIILCDSHVPSI